MKISNAFLIRLSIFIVLITGAVIFDCNRDENISTTESAAKEPVRENAGASSFYINPIKTYSFESETKLIPKRISNQVQNKYLMNLHQIKTYHILKAESLDAYSPLVSFHFLKFRECIYSSPDDDYIA